jgi:hypothetical protein
MRHPRALTPTPGKTTAGERAVSQPHDNITGHITQPGNQHDAVFYTGGAVSRLPNGTGWTTGWGYLTLDGRYGAGAGPQFIGKTNAEIIVAAELRGVWHAISRILAEKPVTLHTSNRRAARILADWQEGSIDMPVGYTGSHQKVPTLERLRGVVTTHPGQLAVHHTRHRTGDLHDGADILARLGMRWAGSGMNTGEVNRRAAGIAAGFLTAGGGRQ